jgi:hypothetical protein
MVTAALSRRSPREITSTGLQPHLDEALRAMRRLGADETCIDAVAAHARTHWEISREPVPTEVWSGEVLWPAHPDAEQPRAVLYPDGPWGRLPGDWLFPTTTQTVIDHMASHLYRWFAGIDYSEEAACTDQVRLMVIRHRRLVALGIAIGLWRHKRIAARRLLRAVGARERVSSAPG